LVFLFSCVLTRLLVSQISGVSATDPWTFATVVTLVAIVGIAACLLVWSKFSDELKWRNVQLSTGSPRMDFCD
jgi:hypothetical protein